MASMFRAGQQAIDERRSLRGGGVLEECPRLGRCRNGAGQIEVDTMEKLGVRSGSGRAASEIRLSGRYGLIDPLMQGRLAKPSAECASAGRGKPAMKPNAVW